MCCGIRPDLLQTVVGKSSLCQLLVFCARPSVVGVWVDADAATGDEQANDLDVFRIHYLYEVFHDGIDAVLVEISVVAEGEEVELEALALHHAHVRDVHDAYLGEVGLPRDGA